MKHADRTDGLRYWKALNPEAEPQFLAEWVGKDAFNAPAGSSLSWLAPPQDFEDAYEPVENRHVPAELRRTAVSRMGSGARRAQHARTGRATRPPQGANQ